MNYGVWHSAAFNLYTSKTYIDFANIITSFVDRLIFVYVNCMQLVADKLSH